MPDSATNSAEQVLYGTLLTLTFVSGLIDAASFIALDHVFTAKMTGNLVLMALALAGTPELSLLRSALALFTALANAVMAGHLDSKIRWEKRTSWLSIALVIEAAGAQMTSWIQVLLDFQRDWTRHATYEGARAIVESNGGYGMGGLAYARVIHPG